MSFLLTLIKNNKLISSGLLIGVLVVGAGFAWNNIRTSIYNQGFKDASDQYTQQMLNLQEEYNTETELKLRSLRTSLIIQHEREVSRIKGERLVDIKTEEVIKYVNKEIFITPECDVVDDSVISLFNESFNRVNSSKED